MYLTAMILIAAASLFMLSAQSGGAEIVGKSVEYADSGVIMKGYLAHDASIKGKRPGVLVVHEWWGHNEYARKRAQMLAELGYTALAVDMYGEGKQADHPEDAMKFSSELTKDFDALKSRFLAAMDFLKKQPEVDPVRIAAIGYCMGGGIVLNMALQGADLKGVASFHGSLPAVKPPKRGAIKAKLIVFDGGDDKFITPEQVEAFKADAKNAGADLTFISYPGVIHGFTNPDADTYAKRFNLALGYNADADRKSWEELKEFLANILKE